METKKLEGPTKIKIGNNTIISCLNCINFKLTPASTSMTLYKRVCLLDGNIKIWSEHFKTLVGNRIMYDEISITPRNCPLIKIIERDSVIEKILK